jgi:hypothetical protein
LVVRAQVGFTLGILRPSARDGITAEQWADGIVSRRRVEPATQDAARGAANLERALADDQPLTRDLERRTIPPRRPVAP